jgi:5-(carboxyamino)imidazole ribonucleotide mutase
MPKGYPVGTMAIGSTGAVNAALMAAAILSLNDQNLAKKLDDWRSKLSNSISDEPSND